MNNKTKTIIISAFWLIIAICFILFNEKIFLTGQTIDLKVHPIDPSDLLRGQYVRLEYDISKIPVKKMSTYERKQQVYVTLKKAPDGLYTAKSVLSKKPANDELYIKGKVKYAGWNSTLDKDFRELNIEYGIENFFTKQDEAKRLEDDLAKKGGIATVVVDKHGRARVLMVK